MDCITESVFNVMCEELKVEYVDKPDVWQYVEGEWCGITMSLIQFDFFTLKPNQTESNHLYKTKTK